MATEARQMVDWEDRLLRWANAGLEVAVFYAVLAAWARPREGPAALLPLLASLALPLAFATRGLLEGATVPPTIRQLAIVLSGLAWAFVVIRLCAPPGYWQIDAHRGALLLGGIFGGREGVGLQPLGFWASILLWWRGYTLPGWSPAPDEALGRLRLGCIAVGAAVAFAAVGDGPGGAGRVQLEQAGVVSLFLVLALLTTGLSRRSEMAGGMSVRPAGDGREAVVTPLRGLAPLLVIGTSAAVLLMAGWGADAISPYVLAPAVALGGRLLELAGTGLAALFRWLVDLWPHLPSLPAPETRSPSSGLEQVERWSLPQVSFPDWFGPLLLGTFVALGMAAFVGLLFLARQGLGMDRGHGVGVVAGGDAVTDESREATGPTTIFALFVRLFRGMFRPRSIASPTGGVPLAATKPNEPGLRSIRSAYRAFLQWAAGQGCDRLPSETPDEFHARLRASHPEADHQAALLTSLYVAARYGGRTVSQSELREAELALRELRSGRVER